MMHNTSMPSTSQNWPDLYRFNSQIEQSVHITIRAESGPPLSLDQANQSQPLSADTLTVVIPVANCWTVRVPLEEVVRAASTNMSNALTHPAHAHQVLAAAPPRNVPTEQTAGLEANETRENAHRNLTQDARLKCWCCLNGPLEVYSLNCGHLVLCSACAVQCNFCPACRAPVREEARLSVTLSIN